MIKKFLFLATFSLSAFEGFVGETLVHGPHGYAPIANIQIGDEITCYNFKNQCVSRPVENKKKECSPEIIEIYLENELLQVAPNQKFLVLSEDEPQWVEAKDLKCGDLLLKTCTSIVHVTDVVRLERPMDVYDISVAEYHNFCVGMTGVHVHNFVIVVTWVFGEGLTWAVGGLAATFFSHLLWGGRDRYRDRDDEQSPNIHTARKPEDYPPGYDDDWKKVRGGAGWIDPDGNRWTDDKKHKNNPKPHWDVEDKKGKKIKEVGPDGQQVWPDGDKNKNKRS